MNPTPSEIGERTEAAVLAALVCAGKRVVIPFGEQRRYDLAFEEDRRLIKVQCKTGWLRAGGIHFRTHSIVHGAIRDYLQDVDFFAVYCHEICQTCLVPVGDVPSKSRATLRLDPPRNGQRARVRWASDYVLSATKPVSASRAASPRPILTNIDIYEKLPGMNTVTATPSIELPVLCCAPLTSATITDNEAQATADLFKALADPHRVRIINLLATCGEPVCVCDINDDVGLSQPTISFHLKKLASAGLVRREQRGTWAYYSLDEQAMKRLSSVVQIKEGTR